jgi:RNA polymerase sigma factor (sigma-70 family)
MMSDRQLLEKYAREGLEAAFTEVVSRHVGLVYATALRWTRGDAHLAQDVTQAVFIDLARKAASLSGNALLPGWLYRHTSFTAAKAIRSERRRSIREQTAMGLNTSDDVSVPSEDIGAHLDESLNQLSSGDRDAIVLRFLKGKGFREVGTALCISEGAAQTRVSRALEKLRVILGKKGITLTGTALASALLAEASVSTPIGLVAGVTAASLKAASGMGTTVALMNLMTTAKLKLGLAATCVAMCAVIPIWVQHRAEVRLRDQADVLRHRDSQLDQLIAENERLSRLVSQATPPLSRGDPSELLRLRGEVGSLRNQLLDLTAELNSLKDEAIRGRFCPRSEWADKGSADPFSAVETMLWAASNNQEGRLQDVTSGVLAEHPLNAFPMEHPPIQSVGAVNLINSVANQESTRAVVTAFVR